MEVVDSTELKVDGMSCATCAQTISSYLLRKGLSDVFVDFSSGEVRFKGVTEKILPEIKTGIENLGYHVVEETEKEEKGKLGKRRGS